MRDGARVVVGGETAVVRSLASRFSDAASCSYEVPCTGCERVGFEARSNAEEVLPPGDATPALGGLVYANSPKALLLADLPRMFNGLSFVPSPAQPELTSSSHLR